VYYGSVAEWVFQNKKGDRKFKNFQILLNDDQLRGKGDNGYIIIGDTGEKDEEAGERIAMTYPDKIRAVFLHKVSDNLDRSKLQLPSDRQLNGVPILYFKTYVGAAKKAYNAGLIDKTAIYRIIEQARYDLNKKDRLPSGLPVAGRGSISSRWKELEDDILDTKTFLQTAQKQKVVMPQQANINDLFSMFDFMDKSKK